MEQENRCFVTAAFPIIGGLDFSDVAEKSFSGTILDPAFAGKPVCIDVGASSSDGEGWIAYKGGPKIKSICIPWSLRTNLYSIGAGVKRLTPILVASNKIVDAILFDDKQKIGSSIKIWASTYAELVRRELDQKLGRPRQEYSGALVAVVDVREDAFTSENYKKGIISSLNIGEVGLSTKVISKLNNDSSNRRTSERNRLSVLLRDNPESSTVEKIKDKIEELAPIANPGSYGLLSRWPTTDVLGIKLRKMKSQSKADSFCIYVPADMFALMGEFDDVSSFMKLVEGDNDGDTLNFHLLKNPAAVAECRKHYDNLVSKVLGVKPKRTVYTYKDHQFIDDSSFSSLIYDEDTNKWKSSSSIKEEEDVVSSNDVTEDILLVRRMDQKLWIGALSIMHYCGHAWLEDLKTRGEELPVTHKEWLDASTQSLELCFDQKHAEKFSAKTLYSLLTAKSGYTWDRVGPILASEGLNGEVYGKVVQALAGQSLRDAAMVNTPFSICHLLKSKFSKLQKLNTVFREIVPVDDVASWFTNNLVSSLKKVEEG